MCNHNKKPRSNPLIDLGFFVAFLQVKSQKTQFDSAPFLLAEAVGFEPTGDFTRHSISSRDRYDHFDTPPYGKDESEVKLSNA